MHDNVKQENNFKQFIFKTNSEINIYNFGLKNRGLIISDRSMLYYIFPILFFYINTIFQTKTSFFVIVIYIYISLSFLALHNF